MSTIGLICKHRAIWKPTPFLLSKQMKGLNTSKGWLFMLDHIHRYKLTGPQGPVASLFLIPLHVRYGPAIGIIMSPLSHFLACFFFTLEIKIDFSGFPCFWERRKHWINPPPLTHTSSKNIQEHCYSAVLDILNQYKGLGYSHFFYLPQSLSEY